MMLTLSALLALLGAASAARTFTDDAGTTHTISGSPTFITDVQDALSLVHFGVHHDQVHATFGTRFQSGSNGRLDGTPQYADGNLATFGVDHNVADYDPSLFPVDPNAMEMAALAQAPNLSPCTGGAYWCTDWDMTPANATAGTPDGHAKVIMDSIGWPDFLIEGAASPSYDYYHIKSAAVVAATPASTKTILITRTDPDTGVTRGLVEMAEKYEELATFLGADAAGHSAADKRLLCSAAASFMHVAKAAHDKGVRAVGVYGPYGDTTKDGMTGGYLYGAQGEVVMHMLEELGMPIYHGPFPTMLAGTVGTDETGLMSATDLELPAVDAVPADADAGTPAVDAVPAMKLNVDFWLYDVRVALDFTSPEFAAAWPHPAVAAKQMAYWPNGGKVYSYHHAQEIITEVGNALAKAHRVTDATPCTEVADIDGTAHRTDGLPKGAYACYHPKTYSWCDAHDDVHSTSRDVKYQAGYDAGVAAVDITSDNQAQFDAGVASVTCADITSDNQAQFDAGVASVDITSDNKAQFDAGAASVDCSTSQAALSESTEEEANLSAGTLAGAAVGTFVFGTLVGAIVGAICAPYFAKASNPTPNSKV